MELIKNLQAWRGLRKSSFYKDKSIGFVPTMGALHAGHLSLVRASQLENEKTVVSIFVNPTQFNDAQDYQAYPQTLEKDLLMLEGLGVDHIFAPHPGEIYPDKYRYFVGETEFSQAMEGQHRAGHFQGMLTVVLKLLQLVKPTRAYFGEKDFQQLKLVEGMVEAFFIDTEIRSCPTVREESGLAMSSRNQRLSPQAKEFAAHLNRILENGRTPMDARKELESLGFKVDYVEDRLGRRFGAAALEGVRLIDNVEI